jgi:hypothetical protein
MVSLVVFHVVLPIFSSAGAVVIMFSMSGHWERIGHAFVSYAHVLLEEVDELMIPQVDPIFIVDEVEEDTEVERWS